MLTTAGVFIFLATSKLQVFYSWPKTVNVEVTFTESLPFPAITVCNQNAYRLVIKKYRQWLARISGKGKPN